MLRLRSNNSLSNSFPSLFDDFWSRDLFNRGLTGSSNTDTTIPAANIKETKDGYEVEIAVPGMDKKDFKIELDGQKLTILAEKTTTNEENENERYVNREFSYQSFSRTFNLAKDVVETDNVMANYENGILKLMIPKKESAKQKPPRLIEIS